VGASAAIAACRSHPLARAARIDKLSLAALEATLRLYLDPALARREIPALAMLGAGRDELDRRAARMAELVPGSRVIEASAKAGGGALPLLELDGPVCAVDPAPLGLDELAARLRAGEPPVIGRAREGLLLLDPRTLTDVEAELAARRVADARG
jgi:L-seryl-tRNA(Ser) seleniumtransferase